MGEGPMEFGDAAAAALIRSIYDAAMAPGDGGSSWQQVLASVQEAGEGDASLLQVRGRTLDQTSVIAAGNIDPVSAKLYQDYYYSRDLWVTRYPKGRDMGGATLSQDFVHEDEMRNSEIYNDLLLPHLGGLFYNFGVADHVSPTEVVLLGVQRKHGRGAFDRRSAASLEAVWKHLLHAMRLRSGMGLLRADLDIALGALDALEAAVLVLKEGGVIALANLPARRLLDRQDGIRSAPGGRIALRQQAEQSRLDAMVGRALAAQLGTIAASPDGIMLVSRDGGRAPLSLLVAPFKPGRREAAERQPPMALVLVSDPDRRAVGLGELAAQLYGLTPAEGAMAEALAAGHSPEEIAERRAVRISTVRTQIQSILSKTGTTRQMELMRLLLTLPQGRRYSPDGD
ncbi:helix-turn-helix transcriptional regulator [Roseomonas populi]|uniref:Helix-turn-helix transcriptional regulator n=1 Tax=Roseomonas populi TaxID=3121582 RepID=A0ABT1X3W2_9PROT|nr:helix-turn-helix transcriptional regulator [Roseomonas pecuniae]MCR0982799.1 helix-turn-helix transcriptional regulator [Roseomonas pecuniae]